MGSSQSFPIVSQPRDRIFVITGGNTGIGYEAAKHIAMMGATVIIACRSETRAVDAIRRINEEYQRDKAEGKLKEGHIRKERLCVEFMKLDLASLTSTMDFVKDFRSSGRPLHVLMCNAGILVERGYTEDNFEMHFQVNYLSHFLLVAHLLPIMKSSGDDCRIISTSSEAYKAARFNLEKSQARDPRDYGSFRYYANSKLYQIQHMYSLSQRLKGTNVTVMSLHPGAVKTEIARNIGNSFIGCCFKCFGSLRLLRTPYQGAITLIDAAVNPRKKGLTAYLVNCEEVQVSQLARNEKDQEDLWKYSLECLSQYLPSDVVLSLEGSSRQEQSDNGP